MRIEAAHVSVGALNYIDGVQPNMNLGQWLTVAITICLAVSVLPAVASCLTNSEEAAMLKSAQEYQQFMREGNYFQAVEAATARQIVVERRFPGESAEMADVLLDLGRALSALGKYSKSVPLLERSCHIRETTVGTADPDYAMCLYWLAAAYYEEGKCTDAEALVSRALDMVEKSEKATPLMLCKIMATRGGLLAFHCRFDEAEGLIRRALSIFEESSVNDDPEKARLLQILAAVLIKHGRCEQAEPLLEQAIVITKTLLGEKHPEMAGSLYRLGGCRSCRDDTKRAEELWLEALKIQTGIPGDGGMDAAAVLTTLGNMYWKSRDLPRAESSWRRALSLRQASLGGDSPLLAVSRVNVASVEVMRDHFDEAEVLLKQAVATLECSGALEKQSLPLAYFWLGIVKAKKERHAEAADAWERALAGLDNTPCPSTLSRESLLAPLATAYRLLGQMDKAREYEAQLEVLHRREKDTRTIPGQSPDNQAIIPGNDDKR